MKQLTFTKEKIKKAIDELIFPTFNWNNNWVITREQYIKFKKEFGL